MSILRHATGSSSSRLSSLLLTGARLLSSQALAVKSPADHGASSTHETPDDSHVSDDTPTPSRRGKQKTGSGHSKAAKHPEPERTLAPSQSKIYLEALNAEGLQPKLSDLERLRPHGYSQPDTPKYSQEFHALVDSLCRSFAKSQLRFFAQEYKLRPNAMNKKVQYAELIIEKAWGWPGLREVERRRRDQTETVVQTFPLSPSELFVTLGKDGYDLLELSKLYSVHVSLTERPLALRVEGIRASLKNVEDHLARVKESIVDETFEVPTKRPVPHGLLQRISRITGAFMANLGDNGKVRICVKDPASLLAAKRLAIRAAMDNPSLTIIARRGPGVDELVVPTAAPINYALYPFVPPSPLPWTIQSSGVFRWRRVGNWFSEYQQSEPDSFIATGGSFMTVNGQQTELKSRLLDGLPKSVSVANRTITASPGHLIFTGEKHDSKVSLMPPAPGHFAFSRALNWIASHDSSAAFLPSLPPDFFEGKPLNQHVIHRLVYEPLPNVEDPQLDSTPSTRFIQFEFTLANAMPDNIGSPLQTPAEPHRASCKTGTTRDLHVLLPDRNMDLCFTVCDSEALDFESALPVLSEYEAGLKTFLTSSDVEVTQPAPPLIINYDGKQFLLVNSVSVRQSDESPSHSLEAKVVSESVLDLESSQKHTACSVSHDLRFTHIISTSFLQLSFEDTDTPEGWHTFLVSCDRLTTKNYSTRHQTPHILPL
ncbi:hypothetical protein FA95DRAFT_1511727 [Auriscalpium vulgare]|uniref:Uncharacterized protein n=1 Tax=Auriscalpium vulgare TaxID=40419 RepID=A0ACB8S6A7_9AGAM|nr:hypothetical protein FA95DRAFT_1511727 [Auriscalpium vulgare]